MPAADTETLQVSFEGIEVATLASSVSVLLGTDQRLPVLKAIDLLHAAGLRDDDSGTHALVVKRRNSTCAAALGITDEVLATVALNFGARPLKVIVDAATADADVPYTGFVEVVRVKASDLSFPFHHVVDIPAKNYHSDMSLKLDDPNTLVWSGRLDSNDQPSGYATYTITGTVTFRLRRRDGQPTGSAAFSGSILATIFLSAFSDTARSYWACICNHDSALPPNAAARRMAMSALTPFLPLSIFESVTRVTPIRLAKSVTVLPVPVNTPSLNTSPG